MKRVPSVTKVAIITLIALATSACDMLAHLDHRDIVHNDQVCQPNKDGACL